MGPWPQGQKIILFCFGTPEGWTVVIPLQGILNRFGMLLLWITRMVKHPKLPLALKIRQ